jgi:ppGpp synthetase/RelA/SpoT-type nucleotidyltranferase
VNEPPDSSLQYSKKQINKAGDRIRRAAARNEQPAAADLQLLNDYRAWHQPTLERCQRALVEVFHGEAGLDSEHLPITGRPLKTIEAITAKLVRSKTRLATMQDIAGTRIVVPDIELQDLITNIVVGVFKDKDGHVAKDTREHGDDYGYRAIHVVATLEGRFAEVQIRTVHQDVWARRWSSAPTRCLERTSSMGEVLPTG